MTLSIIIVNYNVKHFIEQCLHSVLKATKGISCEVFVVDNNSVDGSPSLIKEKFPSIKRIENKVNLGFSKANNQAIKQAKGKYILLLNPDTIVEEDTFKKCIEFMENNPDAGCLGVKMIDGKGDFLPESKRSLPTPFVAFSKIFGFSKIFPTSRIFGKYHLGYLDKNKTHVVDVISGAFMFIRKEAIDKTGILDEDFFMYGEDIDLSYRIQKAGYKNYYYPNTTIVHYKGESTRKSSINYVFVFYRAMIIFARKHFSKQNAKIFSFLINVAIYFRAFLSLLKRFVLNVFLPFTDALVLFSGYLLLIPIWAKYKFAYGGAYPKQFLQYIVPFYILIWLLTIYITGGYEKQMRLINLLKGTVLGSLMILVIYALLPENLRYSRAITLLGAGWATITLPVVRVIFHLGRCNGFEFYGTKKKRMIIVGEYEEAQRVYTLLQQTQIIHTIVGFVSATETASRYDNCLGHIHQLPEITDINKIDEIIFCSRDIPAHVIISNMLKLSKSDIEYKIAPPESISVIGSSSTNTAGELYMVNFDALTKPVNKRSKRLFDIILALLLLVLSPVIMFFIKNPKGLPLNCIKVLFGSNTWVGFYLPSPDLPPVKKGILTPLDIFARKVISKEIIDRANINYAKNYTINSDLEILLKGFKNIGRL